MKKFHTVYQSHKHNHTDLNHQGVIQLKITHNPNTGPHTQRHIAQSHFYQEDRHTGTVTGTAHLHMAVESQSHSPQIKPHSIHRYPHVLSSPQSHNHTPLRGQTLSHSPSQKLLTPPHTITTYNLPQVITRTSPGRIPSHRHSHRFSDS